MGLTFAGPAWAEAPKAVIEGPARVPAGTPIFLDGRKSTSDATRPLQWKSLEKDVTLLTFDDAGRDDVVAILPSTEAGKTYRFVLVAIGAAAPGESLQVDVALLEVTVVPGVAPPITPVPPPHIPPAPDPAPAPLPGKYGLATAARDAVPLVAQPPEHRALVAKALAGAYKSVASQGAAGVLGSPEAFLGATRETNRAVLGANLEAWKPALDAIKVRIDALVTARQLSTVADLSEAWREIAAGLEAAAGGTK